jgi:hypothetical protein
MPTLSFADLMSSRAFRMQLFSGIALMLIAFPIGYFASDRKPPLVFDASESSIIPPSAQGGEQITVLWRVTELRRTCPGTVRRVLFDPDRGVQLAIYDTESSANLGAVQDGFLHKTFMLPKVIQKGEIGYRADLCYACNPLQRLIPALRICYSTPDLKFKIL